MTQNVGYWYNKQIRTIVLHTQRLFSNFYISEGKDDNDNDILRRVPCVFMSSDKSAAALITQNSDTILQTAPKMILTISELRLNNNLSSGAPYYHYETDITEKKFNEETGNYEYEPGNSYGVIRLNPVPIGIIFKLYVVTTMLDQKFQLLEQIRTLFSPTLELQTSENPLDWTRVTAITLTGLNYSSKGTMNLDSTQLDTMDMTFEINTNLDAPALITKQNIVETIINDIGFGDSIEDIWGWDMNDIIRTYKTPTDTTIIVNNLNEITLVPTKEYDNWYKIFKLYGLKYNKNKNNIYVHTMINYDIDKRKEVLGSIEIDESNPIKAKWNIDMDTLPQPNLEPLDAIIDPHETYPKNIEGERYLIVDDIAGNTKIWGKLVDKNGNELSKISENCIIEYKNGLWTLSLNPVEEPAIYYIRDKTDFKYLYTWNDDYHIWVDLINKKYRPGFWRLSQV